MRSSVIKAAFIAFSVVFLFACSDEVTQEKIYGEIELKNADVWSTWVDSGEVQVTLFPEFSLDPLAGWGEVPDNAFGPGVPGGTFAKVL